MDRFQQVLNKSSTFIDFISYFFKIFERKHNSWEREENISDDLIQDFENRTKNNIKIELENDKSTNDTSVALIEDSTDVQIVVVEINEPNSNSIHKIDSNDESVKKEINSEPVIVINQQKALEWSKSIDLDLKDKGVLLLKRTKGG